uniref:Uncharacterized protein n=1 Tax=Anguilla anguilla TaxID=7936 RepID=A0A0E9XBG2_ANGAN
MNVVFAQCETNTPKLLGEKIEMIISTLSFCI